MLELGCTCLSMSLHVKSPRQVMKRWSKTRTAQGGRSLSTPCDLSMARCIKILQLKYWYTLANENSGVRTTNMKLDHSKM
eukprot:g40306.t1